MKTNELITEGEEKRFFDLGYIVEVEKITKTRGRLLNIFTGKCSEIDESKNELYHIYDKNMNPIFIAIENKAHLASMMLRLIS